MLLFPKLDWEKITGAKIEGSEELLKLKDTPINYVIEPVAIRGTLTQIHGAPKMGKSTFSLYCALAAAWGKFPEGSPFSVTGPMRVLYITWEDVLPLLAKRICSYSAGLGFGPTIPQGFFAVYAPDLFLDAKKNVTLLEQQIRDGKYDLVVIDTLSYAHAVDEDKASEIKVVMASLRRVAGKTSASIWYVHHSRKSKEGVMSERARGSTAISAAADVLINWGDRNGDTTPVEYSSKWGRAGHLVVEYFKQPDGSIQWDIKETKKTREAKEERIEMICKAVEQLTPQVKPHKPTGLQLLEVMKDQGMSRSGLYRYLKMAVDEGKLKAIMKPDGTQYEIV